MQAADTDIVEALNILTEKLSSLSAFFSNADVGRACRAHGNQSDFFFGFFDFCDSADGIVGELRQMLFQK